VLAAEPAHFGALHLRGVIEGQRCHYAEAAALIESALRIDPDAAAAHVNLGNTQHALGCLSAALKSYERALGAAAGSPHARDGAGPYPLGAWDCWRKRSRATTPHWRSTLPAPSR
jgi:tetratricopeptide (TPR) repeat protein